MKAVVYKKYGAPEVLEIAEVPKPVPKDKELLINVRAAEATKSDCEMRRSQFAVKWFWLPLRLAMGLFKPRKNILGGYFAGEVESVGKDVTRFSPGDQIFGSTAIRLGAYGAFVCLPENAILAIKPDILSFEEAAAVPLGGLNALHFMRKAKLHKGESILINGAGASIGTFAVQIAKSMGAEVTAVDSGIKEAMLRQIGADHYFDYSKSDFTKSGKTYDVIFDMVAASSYTDCVNLLKPHGRYLMGNPRLSDMIRAVITTRRTDKTVIFAFAGEKEEELLALKAMIEEREICPTVDRVYPFERVIEAHHRVETEQRLGSVVLSKGQI